MCRARFPALANPDLELNKSPATRLQLLADPVNLVLLFPPRGQRLFDMVKRLSVVSRVTGALIRQPPEKETADTGTKPKKGAPTVVSEDPKAAFKLVVRAQRIVDGSGAESGGHAPGSRSKKQSRTSETQSE